MTATIIRAHNQYPPPGTPAGDAALERYRAKLLTICGDVRFLVIPNLSDTTTSTTRDTNARTVTWSSSLASWSTARSVQGSGVLLNPGGTNDYGSMPDAANLSFGDGVNDQAMSGFALIKPTDVATWRWIFAKKDDTTATPLREFGFGIDTADKLILELWDESADAIIANKFDTALTMATTQMVGFSYDGSRANVGSILYRNATALTLNAGTTTGTYTAMENTASVMHLLTNTDTTGAVGSLFPGAVGVMCLTAKFLTLQDHLAVLATTNEYYGLSL